MLLELSSVRQIPEEGFRRWFRDEDFDLIVWYSDKFERKITGFQLCYDKQHDERAVTFIEPNSFQHHKIDDGETPYNPKQSPMLIADGFFEAEPTISAFRGAAQQLEPELQELVVSTLERFSTVDA
ncbi:hypothetical protein [Spirochaeta dissipatitropha]